MALRKLLALATIWAATAIALSGCASSPEASPSNSASASETTTEQPVELSYEDQVRVSYDRFFTTGGSEYVLSGGDNYILTLQPDGDGYLAALYNETFDDVIPIEEPMMITLMLAKTMVDDPATQITETADGIEMRNEKYGAVGFHFTDGYVTSYEALEATWHGTITYQIDLPTIELLKDRMAESE